MNKELQIQATGRILESDDGKNPVQFYLWKNVNRGILHFSDDYIEFFDWKIRQSEINRVFIYGIKEVILPPLFVLRIVTSERIYDFAISSFRNIQHYFIVPVQRETKSIISKKQKFLIFSIILIVVILGVLFSQK